MHLTVLGKPCATLPTMQIDCKHSEPNPVVRNELFHVIKMESSLDVQIIF